MPRTILVAEDDGALRGLLQQVLAASGFSVITAENGADALRLARTHKGRIDLLLTDVAMPQMDGVQLAEILRRERPEIQAAFMTGDVPPEVLAQLESERHIFLKPFDLSSLVSELKTMLS